MWELPAPPTGWGAVPPGPRWPPAGPVQAALPAAKRGRPGHERARGAGRAGLSGRPEVRVLPRPFGPGVLHRRKLRVVAVMEGQGTPTGHAPRGWGAGFTGCWRRDTRGVSWRRAAGRQLPPAVSGARRVRDRAV